MAETAKNNSPASPDYSFWLFVTQCGTLPSHQPAQLFITSKLIQVDRDLLHSTTGRLAMTPCADTADDPALLAIGFLPGLKAEGRGPDKQRRSIRKMQLDRLTRHHSPFLPLVNLESMDGVWLQALWLSLLHSGMTPWRRRRLPRVGSGEELADKIYFAGSVSVREPHLNPWVLYCIVQYILHTATYDHLQRRKCRN